LRRAFVLVSFFFLCGCNLISVLILSKSPSMSFVSTRIPEGNSCIVNLVNDYFFAAIEGLFTLLKRKLKLKLLFLNSHIHQPPFHL